MMYDHYISILYNNDIYTGEDAFNILPKTVINLEAVSFEVQMKKMCKNRHVYTDEGIDKMGKPLLKIQIPDQCPVCGEKMEEVDTNGYLIHRWIMPAWMKPYAKMILNTGGNSIEDLVNDDGKNSNVFNNAPRALICASVKSQVGLLEQLYDKGLLKKI
jgi:hypothetical protein